MKLLTTRIIGEHALVVEAEGFSDALALVVATADTDGIDRAPVTLRLRVDLRIAVDLTRAGEQQPRPYSPRQAQHVISAEEAGFGCLDRIELIVNRRSRASEMPDPIHLELDRFGDVVE